MLSLLLTVYIRGKMYCKIERRAIMDFILSEINFLSVNKTIDFFNQKSNNSLKGEIILERNNKSISDAYYRNKFEKAYGENRYNEFCKNPKICYKYQFPAELQPELEKLSYLCKNKDEIKKIYDKVYQFPFSEVYKVIFVLSTAIWLLKDSCVQEKNTYHLTGNGYYNSTRIDMPYTLANGKQKVINVTEDEWKQVGEYFELIGRLIYRYYRKY